MTTKLQEELASVILKVKETLMYWWGVVTEDWNNVKKSLEYESINKFQTLKMMMDNIITRMRLKILLNKMQDLL